MRLEFNRNLALPPEKAAAVEPKSMLWSIFTSEGLIPFLDRIYSKTISGMPPALPPSTFLPLSMLHWKFSTGCLATRKFPARWVSWAKLTT